MYILTMCYLLCRKGKQKLIQFAFVYKDESICLLTLFYVSSILLVAL